MKFEKKQIEIEKRTSQSGITINRKITEDYLKIKKEDFFVQVILEFSGENGENQKALLTFRLQPEKSLEEQINSFLSGLKKIEETNNNNLENL